MKINLDDIETLYKLDTGNAISNVLKYPEVCLEAYKLDPSHLPKFPVTPKTIIIAGMGGSGISGDIIATWLQNKIRIPIVSVKDYDLPSYVDESTLVVVVSYSGNTEETLNVFSQALKRKAKILAVTSNGKLKEYCQKIKIPFVCIPSKFQPREAIIYLTIPIASFLEKLGLVNGLDSDIKATAKTLQKIRSQIRPEVSLEKNPAKTLALQILNTVPVIYGAGIQKPIAYRMKCQLNENSKIHAFYGTIPEMNHNEIVGWSYMQSTDFSAIFLRYHGEREEIKARIDVIRSLFLERKAKRVLEIWGQGEKVLEQMFSTMFIGDMASLYLAFLRNVNPSEIRPIEKLKKELEKRGTKQRILQELTDIINSHSIFTS